MSRIRRWWIWKRTRVTYVPSGTVLYFDSQPVRKTIIVEVK